MAAAAKATNGFSLPMYKPRYCTRCRCTQHSGFSVRAAHAAQRSKRPPLEAAYSAALRARLGLGRQLFNFNIPLNCFCLCWNDKRAYLMIRVRLERTRFDIQVIVPHRLDFGKAFDLDVVTQRSIGLAGLGGVAFAKLRSRTAELSRDRGTARDCGYPKAS